MKTRIGLYKERNNFAVISYAGRMLDWLELLIAAVKRDGKAVVVTVVATDGSVPREIGATMVVSDGGNYGTIGGGNLEFTCVRAAHELLQSENVRKYKQLSLGPGLGQCCGGRIELLLECVSAQTQWFSALTTGHDAEANQWLCRALDSQSSLVKTADELVSYLQPGVDLLNHQALVVKHNDADRWFCQSLSQSKPTVWIYGAGHVGQAVVSQLSLLECDIVLLDHREDWQAFQPDLILSRVLTDTPEDDAIRAPTDAVHVVMTHSHALDFEICYAILKRAQFGWLGLIGSDTKRQTFVNRLRQRGVSDDVICRLRCPIGNLRLDSSHPSVIALNLASELAMHWQTTIAGR